MRLIPGSDFKASSFGGLFFLFHKHEANSRNDFKAENMAVREFFLFF
jgi:hypothetical protein